MRSTQTKLKRWGFLWIAELLLLLLLPLLIVAVVVLVLTCRTNLRITMTTNRSSMASIARRTPNSRTSVLLLVISLRSRSASLPREKKIRAGVMSGTGATKQKLLIPPMEVLLQIFESGSPCSTPCCSIRLFILLRRRIAALRVGSPLLISYWILLKAQKPRANRFVPSLRRLAQQ